MPAAMKNCRGNGQRVIILAQGILWRARPFLVLEWASLASKMGNLEYWGALMRMDATCERGGACGEC